ncbi:hypothetical protein LTR86_005942 [Recurvomyces mirabilis]|nr:hypothetical protein LTR86_005942 [Recurvomyces mirabilis]
MPSPRGSPALRPSSPLSPGYKPAPQFETLQLPRAVHSRAKGSGGRRGIDASLKLSSLPRFHPANYPSASSSLQSTPHGPSSNGPLSPRSHQRVLSDVQRQIYAYQRESVSTARASSPGAREKPNSPRLAPLGSPGLIVTPLELESHGDYLVAGIRGSTYEHRASTEIADALIREEVARNRNRLSQGSNGDAGRRD